MYAGHFAAALAIKGRAPRAPTWGLLVGAGLLDLLFAPFALLGLERVSVTPGAARGLSFDHIDWSHSLATAVLWSALFGLLFRRHGRATIVAMAAAVFSHFVLDVVVHPADLALWPGAATHLGFDLWNRLPVGSWFVELAVIAAGTGYYWVRARKDGSFGGRAWAVALVVGLLHALNSPWVAGG